METNLEPPVLSQSQNRTWDALCHLMALAGFVGLPFGNVLGPLIFWIVKKDESASVDEHGKESLNFQISMTIYTIVAGLSLFILIGIALLPAILVLNLVLTIIAGVKASNGEPYRYPLSIRFIK
jgi:uncharacterized protein